MIRGNQDCTNISGETVRRCFDITPATPPTTGANLTFFFDASEEAGNACTSMNAYHHNGSTWVLQTLDLGYGVGGRNCASTPRSVRVTGVTSFSPFALDAEAPTAVTLAGFSVSAASMGMLLLVVIAIGISLVALLLVVRTRRQTA